LKIDEKNYRTIWPIPGAASPTNESILKVGIIDQTKLPHQFKVLELSTMPEMALAITNMQVRGAPLIGAAGPMDLH
jgi:methylthioribose-1-phosphate isomerase